MTDETPVDVPHQDAGQQARLAQDLEAIADAEHKATPRAWARTASIAAARPAMAPQRR